MRERRDDIPAFLDFFLRRFTAELGRSEAAFSPDAVELLQEFLAGKGYEVVTARNGEEALERLKADRPHLVLLDIRMPGMNGLDVLRRVRQIDKEVGVIMVTAVTSQTGLDFTPSGPEQKSWVKADVILPKPVRFEQLKREIDRLLAREP